MAQLQEHPQVRSVRRAAKVYAVAHGLPPPSSPTPRAKLLFGIADPESLIGSHGGFVSEEEARKGWEHHREEIIRCENRHPDRDLFVPPPFWYYDAPHIDAQRVRVPDKAYRGGYRNAETDAALAARFGLPSLSQRVQPCTATVAVPSSPPDLGDYMVIFYERAALCEHDGGLDRIGAERLAMRQVLATFSEYGLSE